MYIRSETVSLANNFLAGANLKSDSYDDIFRDARDIFRSIFSTLYYLAQCGHATIAFQSFSDIFEIVFIENTRYALSTFIIGSYIEIYIKHA